MKNFEINNNLCILWTNKCHTLLIEKINNENSLLNMILNNFEKNEFKPISKKLI
jgi:hypothetical protein